MASKLAKDLENIVNETLNITSTYLGFVTFELRVPGQYPEKWEEIQNYYFSSEGNDHYFVLSRTPNGDVFYRTLYCPQCLLNGTP